MKKDTCEDCNKVIETHEDEMAYLDYNRCKKDADIFIELNKQ